MCDMEKCFGGIPRKPIYVLARWIGIPSKVVTAWFSFLPTMKRSFIVCGNPSEALDSDCGLPEGDSLSCLGMVLLNFSYH